MTDVPEVPTPEGQSTSATDTAATTQKGRPRPDATVQQDEQAKQYFTEVATAGLTREALAEKLGATPSKAYLSIYRLSRANPPVIRKTRDGGKVVWKLTQFVTDEATEPTPAPEGEAATPEPAPAPQL